MKIAIFTDCYLDLPGGIPAVINAEKQELEKRGHTVYIFSTAYRRSREQRNRLAKENIFIVPCCRNLLRGVTPVSRRPGLIEKWLHYFFPELQKFDLFYIHYEAGCSIAGLRYGKKLGIPTVQVMHGREDVGEEHATPRGFRTLVAIFLNWVHSWYIPHPLKVPRDDYLARTLAASHMWTLMVNHANYADLIITPSQHFADKLKRYGVTREIIPLHHGIGDKLIAAPHAPRLFTPGQTLWLIWHSRVSGEKRIMPLLEALTMIHGKYHLHVYGMGTELKKAQRYAKRHQLHVTFHGQANPAAVYPQIERSHLDILVSYNFDTFGMTLVEAESAGTPVFIVDPDLKEIVPEGGYLFADSPSPADMAAALNSLFSHPEEIERMSHIMLTHRSQIKNSTKINHLEQIFQNLLHSHPARDKIES